MKGKINQFLAWAKEKGWKIQDRTCIDPDFPSNIIARYKKIPDEFIQFISLVDVCAMPDEKSWFLCISDYSETSDSAFSWNEYEKMSLEAAKDDCEWKKEITEYWDRHLPVALCVRNDYAYYALDVGADFGAVLYSFEPYFEEGEKVASSFLEFLDGIMSGKIDF